MTCASALTTATFVRAELEVWEASTCGERTDRSRAGR